MTMRYPVSDGLVTDATLTGSASHVISVAIPVNSDAAAAIMDARPFDPAKAMASFLTLSPAQLSVFAVALATAANAPINTVAPVTSGTLVTGETLSVTDGTWTGTPTPDITYQWTSDDVAIGGATAATHVIGAGEAGTMVAAVVTGTNSIDSSDAIALAGTPVAATAPLNNALATVTGTRTSGSVLTAHPGTWTGLPAPVITYQWTRDASNLSGQTAATYTIVAGDISHALAVKVTGTNTTSAVTTTVAAGTPAS